MKEGLRRDLSIRRLLDGEARRSGSVSLIWLVLGVPAEADVHERGAWRSQHKSPEVLFVGYHTCFRHAPHKVLLESHESLCPLEIDLWFVHDEMMR